MFRTEFHIQESDGQLQASARREGWQPPLAGNWFVASRVLEEGSLNEQYSK